MKTLMLTAGLWTLFSCTSSNVLKHSRKKYFREYDSFFFNRRNPLFDSLFTITQTLLHDDPKCIDDETSDFLMFQFLDTAAAKRKRMLNIGTDTTIVKASYRFSDFVNVFDRKIYSPSGRLEITKWTPQVIELKEDLSIIGERLLRPVFYQGKRCFQRDTMMESLLQSR